MLGLQSGEPRCEWFHSCHQDGSLVPCSALQSISVVFGALVGLPLCLCCRPPFRDHSSSIHSRGIYLPTYCLASVFFCLVCLVVSLFVTGDTRVSPDPVHCSFDAVGADGPSMLVDRFCKMLPWPWVQVRCPSDGHLRITKHCHCRDSMWL